MESMSCTDLRDLSHGRSFSFSCSESDLNFSYLSHFTEDDDASDDDDESYFEIALDHHDHLQPTLGGDEEGHVGGLDHVDYLRISFSSSLLQEYTPTDSNMQEGDMNINTNVSEPTGNHPVNRQMTSSSATCTLSYASMESSCRSPVEGSDRDSPRLHRNTARRRRMPRVNRLVNTILFGLRSSSEVPIHEHNAGLAQSRQTSKMRTSINGGIMKLLFKVRTVNLGALVASFVKPRHVACDDHDGQPPINGQRKIKKSKESAPQYHQKLLKPIEKWLAQKKQWKCNSSEVAGGGEKYSRVLEINLGAVRGVLEAIGNSMSTGVGRKERKTMSCPSSIKSSPIHKGFSSDDHQSNKVYVYASETSIQAAIAHCKTSFEQTSIS